MIIASLEKSEILLFSSETSSILPLFLQSGHSYRSFQSEQA